MADIDYFRVFEALPSPYMLLDHELRYVTANPAYVEAVGKSLDEMRGRHLFDLFPNEGESGRRLRQSLRRVLSTGQSDTLAHLHYPIENPDGTWGDRYWTAVHTPILDSFGRVLYVMQNTVDVTDYVRMREAATLPFRALHAETALLQRTQEAEQARQEVEAAHQALLAESTDFRRLFQQAPGFFAVLSGPEHIFTFASDGYTRLVGGRGVLGLSVREALPEVVGQGFIDILDRVYTLAEPYSATGARMTLGDGAQAREVVLDFSYSPIRNLEGTVTGIFVQGADQTERELAIESQGLLIAELNHRVKNALATVQSIAAQTLRSTADPVAARQAFEARLRSLAQAHSMLSDRNWTDTELAALVRQELAAYDGGQISVDGPPVVLNSKATIALSLLLHELATNAAKYGSLSVPDGRLALSWCEDGAGMRLEWRESGGPPVAAPSRKGFGTRMLRLVVTGELGGTLDVDYPPDGFHTAIHIPATAYKSVMSV